MNRISLNNKGSSLVELLVALGISSIILTGVGFFINAGSKSYRATSVQATLQNETQDVLNYLNNLSQGCSDAGWRDGIFYVLQPISIETTQTNTQPNYYVHCVKFVENQKTMYYVKKTVQAGDFTVSNLTNLRNDVSSNIAKEENIISNQVTFFNAVVERVCKSGQVAEEQSLSNIVYSLDVVSQGTVKGSKISVKPRNYITDVNYTFAKTNMGLTPTRFGNITETGVVARPGGDYYLNGVEVVN